MRRRVILFGPPGSGKATSAGRLKNEFERFSTGHVLRQEVANGSAVGRPAGLFLERSERVPGEPAQTLAGVRQ